MQVLFLPSWFPTKSDVFNGIFILRHAKAIAEKHGVTVAYAKREDKIGSTFELEHTIENNVDIHICYFKGSSLFLLGKLINFLRYRKAWKKALHASHLSKKFDLVHIHVVWPVGLIYWLTKYLHTLPLLISEHWSGYLEVDGNFEKQKLNRYISKKVFKKASIVTVVSEKNKHALLKHQLHRDVRVISNVVDGDTFFLKEKAKSDLIHFIHVSTFVERIKNINNLLNAFEILNKRTPNVKLSLVGNEKNFEQYKIQLKQLKEKGLNIEYHGVVPESEVAKLMQCVDAIVLPSYFEGQPCVLVEALYCGLPFIATKVGGIPDIANPENAVLIQDFSASSIADAMFEFIEKRSTFVSEKIAGDAQKLYSKEAIEASFTKIYEETIAMNNAR